MSLKKKYWRGWISTELSDIEVGKIWHGHAVTAEKQKSELHLFRIPKENLTQFNLAITEIESLLQKIFGK